MALSDNMATFNQVVIRLLLLVTIWVNMFRVCNVCMYIEYVCMQIKAPVL